MRVTILSCLNYKEARTSVKCAMHVPVVDLGEAPPPPFPIILGKKGEVTEGGKAGRASKTESPPPPLPPTPPLSSRSGSANVYLSFGKISESL